MSEVIGITTDLLRSLLIEAAERGADKAINRLVMGEELRGVQSIAKYLGIAPETLRRRRREGRYEGIIHGRGDNATANTLALDKADKIYSSTK